MFERIAKFIEEDAEKFRNEDGSPGKPGDESYRARTGTAIFFAVACVCGGAAAVYMGQTQNEPLLVAGGIVLNAIAGLILLASMLGTLAACADFLKQIADQQASVGAKRQGNTPAPPAVSARGTAKQDL